MNYRLIMHDDRCHNHDTLDPLQAPNGAGKHHIFHLRRLASIHIGQSIRYSPHRANSRHYTSMLWIKDKIQLGILFRKYFGVILENLRKHPSGE